MAIIEKNDEQDVSEFIDNVITIQELIEQEKELFNIIEEVSIASSFSQINNGTKVLQYQLEKLTNQSNKIDSIPSAVTYLQLLSNYAELLLPEKMLHKALLKKLESYQAVGEAREHVNNLLKAQHLGIQSLVSEADGHFADLKSNTSKQVAYGNNVLLLCFSFSILTSVILTTYFIRNKIVGRLTTLGNNLEAIGQGRWDVPIYSAGRDEISLINQKLSTFIDQMKEMERTNALNLLNNTQASIITCELNGCIESINHSARQLFCKDTKQAKSPLWQWFPEQHRSQIQSLFETTSQLRTKGHDSVSITFGDSHSPSFLKLDLHQYLQGSQTKVIVTITDITEQIEITHLLEKRVAEKTQSLQNTNMELVQEVEERKRTEQHLKSTQDELVHAAKMAVVGQTMTSLAHELNQPLSAISAYLFSAKYSINASNYDSVNQSLTKIEELTERMSKIINNLRQFARKKPGDSSPVRVELSDAVTKAVEIISSKAKQQQITIESFVPDDLATCAEAVQIEQILINLLVNACDAVSEANNSKGNWIKIEGYTTEKNTICLTVSDSGDGFNHDVIDKIFTPFTTTKEVGLGLGLMISQSLISRFNGNIYLASDLNGGATVVMEVPCYES
ncbi:ATP-binding protein [Vibrio hannami]|uniref:ATP-binding protein n=1 Tax=Vibrio hannami TaxID=2717094 RepID=UPI00240E9CC8|nr:ATP-binding protein [Vibrio hannami]MDG3086834.1 ATP-binding protein [Vibrio hannami]